MTRHPVDDAPHTGDLVLPPADFSHRRAEEKALATLFVRFAPDRRLFVCEQDGTIRMIKDDMLLDTPVLQIPGVRMVGERGFMGLDFDPEFAQNGFIYAYYTVEDPIIHNRVSRFTVDGDRAVLDRRPGRAPSRRRDKHERASRRDRTMVDVGG